MYYSFTTGSRPMAHLIDLENFSYIISWTLSAQPDFSSTIKGCYQTSNNADCQTNTLAANTKYYLKLQSYSSSKTNYTISINRVLENEGTTTPVQLTVGSTYEGMLAAKIYTNSVLRSFYTFTTGSVDSNYTISLSGAQTDVRWMLFTDTFYSGVRDCDELWQTGNESCTTTVPLVANTKYYLAVENRGTQGSFFKVDISNGGTHVNTYSDQGSVANPTVLATGSTQTGSISPKGTSYYKFNTNTKNANYAVNLNRVSGVYQLYLYKDSNFTNLVDTKYYGSTLTFNDISWKTILLDANSTFYLKLVNYSNNNEDKFEIAVIEDSPQNSNSEGTTITPILLTPDITYQGTVGNYSNSYYKFNVSVAKPYQISVTNGQTDLSWSVTKEFNNTSVPTFLCDKVYGVGDEVCKINKGDAGGTLYMSVYDNDATSPSTFNISIAVVEGEGEGTYLTPASVTPGVSYASSLGAVDKTSYYQFTTGAELAKYRISVTGASTETAWVLFEADGSGTTSVRCERYDQVVSNMICETGLLKANTAHKIQVFNKGTVATPIIVTVSNGTPIQMITMDTTLTGQSYDGDSNNYGYYKFTTGGTGGSYTIQMTGFANSASVTLFQDQLYTSGGFPTCSTPTTLAMPAVSCTINQLMPDTIYYLRTYISKNSGITDSFNIAALNDSYAENNITLTPSTDYLGKVPSKGFSSYQFTTAGGGPKNHSITLSGPSGYCVRLYSDAAHTAFLDGTCQPTVSVGTPLTLTTTNTLKAGTTYYVVVEEQENFSNKFTLNVKAL